MNFIVNGDKWRRVSEEENGKIHRFWRHEEGHELKVEEFEDGTWDAVAGDVLLENYDSPEEAVERLKDHVLD